MTERGFKFGNINIPPEIILIAGGSIIILIIVLVVNSNNKKNISTPRTSAPRTPRTSAPKTPTSPTPIRITQTPTPSPTAAKAAAQQSALKIAKAAVEHAKAAVGHATAKMHAKKKLVAHHKRARHFAKMKKKKETNLGKIYSITPTPTLPPVTTNVEQTINTYYTILNSTTNGTPSLESIMDNLKFYREDTANTTHTPREESLLQMIESIITSVQTVNIDKTAPTKYNLANRANLIRYGEYVFHLAVFSQIANTLLNSVASDELLSKFTTTVNNFITNILVTADPNSNRAIDTLLTNLSNNPSTSAFHTNLNRSKTVYTNYKNDSTVPVATDYDKAVKLYTSVNYLTEYQVDIALAKDALRIT